MIWSRNASGKNRGKNERGKQNVRATNFNPGNGQIRSIGRSLFPSARYRFPFMPLWRQVVFFVRSSSGSSHGSSNISNNEQATPKRWRERGPCTRLNALSCCASRAKRWPRATREVSRKCARPGCGREGLP